MRAQMLHIGFQVGECDKSINGQLFESQEITILFHIASFFWNFNFVSFSSNLSGAISPSPSALTIFHYLSLSFIILLIDRLRCKFLSSYVKNIHQNT